MKAEPTTYRLYSCARCGAQVNLCLRCDRGNRYCVEGCARIRRRESLLRAGARYQRSYRGACRHAARQYAWRARCAQKVRNEMAKKIHQFAEEGRTQMRQVRRDANDHAKKLEKDKTISQDDEKRALERIQKLTDQYVKAIDDLAKKKEKEILEI